MNPRAIKHARKGQHEYAIFLRVLGGLFIGAEGKTVLKKKIDLGALLRPQMHIADADRERQARQTFLQGCRSLQKG
jgi:hypothetical protein